MRIFCFILALVWISAISSSAQSFNGGIKKEQEKVELQEPVSDPEIDRVISIVKEVEDKQNFIEDLLPDSNAVLPIGMIRQIGEARYVIAIDSMHFKKNMALFSAYAAIDFPGSLKKMAFRASGISFNPNGVIGGEQAKLLLVSDHLIKINRNVWLHLSAKNENWVEWDCKGFKAIHLTGHFLFRKGLLIPDSLRSNDSVVRASFQLHTGNLHEFVAAVSISPFRIAGLPDLAFRVENAVVDMSELYNAKGMVFPKGYYNPNMPDPNMWTGFALKSLMITLPKAIGKVGTPTEIGASNLLIDHTGVSGRVYLKPVFEQKEASLSGWDFSVDEIELGFLCNRLNEGSLKGKIQIPLCDSTQSITYLASVQQDVNTKQLNYLFAIKPTAPVRFKVFSADATLYPNSGITVSRVNGYLKPLATLNGKLQFDHSLFHTGLGALEFQELALGTDAPYITNGIFSLHTLNADNPKMDHYPVTLTDIAFGIDKGTTLFGLGVRLNLSDAINTPLTVETALIFKGKIEVYDKRYGADPKNGIIFKKTRWSFDKLSVNQIGVDIETAPFTLKGAIQYNDNVPGYGKGFMGSLDLRIRKVLDDPIGVATGFGAKESYRYFFLDAKVPTRYIIPSTPIGVSSMVGGFYYHMKPNKSTENDFIALSNSFKSIAGHALIYKPDSSVSIGFKVGATGEFIYSESAFNGDFLLDVHFNRNGGLGSVSLGGNIYSMAKIADRAYAPVKGKAILTYDPETKTFDGTAQVNMSYYSVITGSGSIKAHFEPQLWNVCIGKPSSPNTIRFANLINVPSYFMTGNSLEACIQPPAVVSAQSQIAAVISDRNQQQLSNGGFVAGARVHSSLHKTIGFRAFNVKGDFDFDLGCDMMMSDYGPGAVCVGANDPIGINGRLMEGTMYLAAFGHVEMSGRFKFPANCPTTRQVCVLGVCETVNVPCILDEDFKHTIFSTGVNAIVSARLPKPLYFESKVNCSFNLFGREAGSFDFNYDYGTNCQPRAK